MERLSDEALIDAYMMANEMKLDEAFIKLLLEEIQRRRLPIPDQNDNANQ